ncbi:MAG: hypothetical protein ACRC1P_00440 [Cellulosilyticaceae bacterium]
MFHLKMIYKTRPKTLLLGTVLLFLYTLIATLGMKDMISWFYIKLFIIVFPVFYTGNVISNEYEYSKQGIIFTTKTPIYAYGFKQFGAALLVNILMLILMYLSAYAAGLEYNLLGFIPLVAYACFLSTLAFLVSNLTGKNAAGFAAAILYWGLFFMAGSLANETLMPFSVIINLTLSYDIVWYNVLSMFCFSLILFLINIWYLGKGEGIRLKLACLGLPTTFILIVLLIVAPDTSYLTRTDWHTKTAGNTKLLYQDLPANLDDELLTIWEVTYDVLVDILGKDTVYDTLQISCKTGRLDNPISADEAVTLQVLRSAFNHPMIGGDAFYMSIPEEAFLTHFFSQLDDYHLSKGFMKYLTYTRIFEPLYTKHNPVVNAKYFSYANGLSEKEYYLESLTNYLDTPTISYWMAEEVSGLMLYAIDQTSPTALNEFLLELSQAKETLSLEAIRTIAYNYTDPTLIDNALELLEQAKVAH